MISYITGKVLKVWTGKDCFADILTSAGIGYRVYITKKAVITKGESISLFTYFHVREDAQTLFGFLTEEERDFFERLISVSGIGPKLALSILSTYSKGEIEEYILNGDDTQLSKTPGLGSKGAQKIILELRGKIDFKKEDEKAGENKEIQELKLALKSLGFVGEALKTELEKGGEILKKDKEIGIETLIKKVLAN
jgi:Holliday junction DNA helicase RuvA